MRCVQTQVSPPKHDEWPLLTSILLVPNSHCVTQLQAKAGHKEKRLGWGARLEAAAQAGASIEVNPKSLLSITGRPSPQHNCREHTQSLDLTGAAFALSLICLLPYMAAWLTYTVSVHAAYIFGTIVGVLSSYRAEAA